jgi:hypothetical protein
MNMTLHISLIMVVVLFLTGLLNLYLSTSQMLEAHSSSQTNNINNHNDLFRSQYMVTSGVGSIQEENSLVGTFYYPWWRGENEGYQGWNVDNHEPPSTWRSMFLPDMIPGEFKPEKELYSVVDPLTVKKQLEWMKDAGIQFAIASWFGPSEEEFSSDYAFSNILHKIMPVPDNPNGNLKWTILYEDEGTSDPPVEELIEDLNYIKEAYASSPYYLRIEGKPVVFVYNAIGSGQDPLDDLERWMEAKDETGFYVVMRDDPLSEGKADPSSMDGWYRYKPGLRYDQVGNFSASVSPGYWRYHDSSPVLERNPSAFEDATVKLAAADVKFKLVLTWNEWMEGTGVEPAQQILHNDKDNFKPAKKSYGHEYIDILGRYLTPNANRLS